MITIVSKRIFFYGVVVCYMLTLVLFEGCFYSFASIKQTSCDYNLVTFDLIYKNELPPQHFEPLWGLAIPDISLLNLRLIPYNQNNTNIVKILDLNQVITHYPISNTYIENNIKFILIDQFKLLKSLKTDQEKLKLFRKQTKKLLNKFLKDTQIYNKYKNFIETYKLNTNFYNLTNTIRQKSIKRAKLLQSTSPYQSIKSTKIPSNGIQKETNINSQSTLTSDNSINLIIQTIKLIKDNWWIILAVLIYIYIVLIFLRKR